MDNYSFVAIFTSNSNGSYTITFPDFPGCISEGDSLENARYMAKDVLELHLFSFEKDNISIPKTTCQSSVILTSNQSAHIIEVNMSLIRKEMSNKFN